MLVSMNGQLKDQEFDSIPVVSPTSGEGSAAKQVYAIYDWFDQIQHHCDWDGSRWGCGCSYKEIFAAVLPKEKLRIVCYMVAKTESDVDRWERETMWFVIFIMPKSYHWIVVSRLWWCWSWSWRILDENSETETPQLSKLQAAMRGGIKSTVLLKYHRWHEYW